MMGKSQNALGRFGAVLCAVALLSAGYSLAEKQTESVTGKIKKAEVRDGKVRSVLIKDPARGEILVVRNTDQGKLLLDHVGKTVKATGYVRKSFRDPQYTSVIEVMSFEILPAAKTTADAEKAEP